MNEIVKDFTGIAMAIVGLALLYTIVNPNNATSKVISAATSGFGSTLSAAMGGGTQNNGLTAFGMN